MKTTLAFLATIGITFLSGCNSDCIAQTINPQEAQPTETQAQQESSKMQTTVDSNESFEPAILGKLSHDLKDAEGKFFTQIEYRYVSDKGELLSVVANFKSERAINDIVITERQAPGSEPKVIKHEFNIGMTVMICEQFRKLLYENPKKDAGMITWINAPERSNWKNDKSTTWLIVHYGDIQYVVSSRQDLPEDRYYAFTKLYSYMISHVKGYHRKMQQDIGEPLPPIIQTIHDKKVHLVPGTGEWGNYAGAEIKEYADKKWWIEEEFNATFRTTPETQKLNKNRFYDEEVTSADITIDDNGNYTLHINNITINGYIDKTRTYLIVPRAHFQNGNRYFWFNYYDGNGFDDKHKRYRRIELKFPGEPYVHGRGAIEPCTIILDRE